MKITEVRNIKYAEWYNVWNTVMYGIMCSMLDNVCRDMEHIVEEGVRGSIVDNVRCNMKNNVWDNLKKIREYYRGD